MASCDTCPAGWFDVFSEYCGYGCYYGEHLCVLPGYGYQATCGGCPPGMHAAATIDAPCSCGGWASLCLDD
jgi:hypothetical protein